MTTLVTGATGTVGHHVLRVLLDAGEEVRALTRRPRTAGLPRGAVAAGGDLTDPASWPAALSGVDRIHLISLHDAATVAAAPAFARAAARAGVRRATAVPGGGDEYAVEQMRAAGVPTVHVEPWEYMANTLEWAGAVRSEGAVYEPFADFRSSVVHEADIGAMAAALLLGDHPADRIYEVTGPAALSRRTLVEQLAEALGRPLRLVELGRAGARERWTADGAMPTEVADWLLDVRAEGSGMDHVTGDVLEVLGRPALPYSAWAADHAAAFR